MKRCHPARTLPAKRCDIMALLAIKVSASVVLPVKKQQSLCDKTTVHIQGNETHYV